MDIKKKTSAVLAALALAGAMVLAGAAPANALSSCAGSIASDGKYRVQCNSGTGQVRAWVACKAPWTFGYTYSRMGEWVGRGQVSVASCEFGASSQGYGGWENR
jgi:hypothetical protein